MYVIILQCERLVLFLFYKKYGIRRRIETRFAANLPDSSNFQGAIAEAKFLSLLVWGSRLYANLSQVEKTVHSVYTDVLKFKTPSQELGTPGDNET